MGVFLSVKTNLILTPTDGIVKTISEVFSFPFSIVKNTFDITLVFVTIILCLINHTPFYGLGIGTILTALFIGRIINIYETINEQIQNIAQKKDTLCRRMYN